MSYVALASVTLLASCCVNVIFLEHLIKASPDCGTITLFLQFLFTAVEGFLTNRKFGTAKRHVPLKSYGVMVVLFFSATFTNNLALNFNVPMPLHMIFKSGSLVANLCLGVILLKRSYPLSKYVSVVFVSIGIFICTLATSMEAAERRLADGSTPLSTILIGTVFLTISLFLSARLGIFQESLSLKYGKHSKEALFYNHALPIPFFILFASNIQKSAALFSASEQTQFPFFTDVLQLPTFASYIGESQMPILWQYMLMNVITQYICIRSVFYLTSECSSLTVTLLITLRKFISLFLSILLFNNTFTLYHYIGAFLVFFGSLIYANVIDINFLMPKQKSMQRFDLKKKK